MKSLNRRILATLLPLAFAILFIFFAVPGLTFGATIKAIGVPLLLLHFLVLSILGGSKLRSRGRLARWDLGLWVVALIATLPFAFTKNAFGVGDLNSILMTIGENRTTEMVAVGMEGFVFDFWITIVKTSCLMLLGYLLIVYSHMGRSSVLVLATLLLVGNPVTQFGYRMLVPHPDQALIASDLENLAPKVRKTPDIQKNLIFVYLESLERTYTDLEVTQDAFSQLAQIEQRGHAFPNLHQLQSTFFTAGGLVASQCGVPLLPRGVFNARRRIHDNIDVIPEETDFLLGATCLGDILTDNGYNASYINGSSLSIFSKGAFFESHGFQRVKGLESYPGYRSEPRTNVWGMNDDLLFERLKDELRWLARQDRPFVLTALTIATHGPDGYLDDGCQPSNNDELPLASAIRCSGQHVQSLIQEVDTLGLGEDTLVILLSDHLAFKNTFHSELLDLSDQRRNYAVILGDTETTNMREGTALDIYPTVLEILGFELEGNRAGLGRSLVGDNPTLLEAYGVNRVNSAIHNNASLQRAIWNFDPSG